ncbi:MAG: hypothetical protein ABI384_07815 [Allobranchiibius sp.]
MTSSATTAPILLGGEMTGWCDGIDPPSALTAWVATVLSRSNGSVLLIGPRAAGIAQHLGARADVLVRGTIDADRLHSEGVRVQCGGLDRLPTRAGYDTVVMLDGPDRVLTPDSPGLGHLDVLDLAATHAGDRLIAYVPNALAAYPLPHSRASGDPSWWVGSAGYDERVPVQAELPAPPARVVFGDIAVVEYQRIADPLTTTTMRAALVAHQGWLDAEDAGACSALATGWVLVRGTALPQDLPTVFATTLPEPSVTAGDPLEVLLTSALRVGGHEQIGALICSYADLVAALPADQRALAAPRNVVRTDAGVLALRIEVSRPSQDSLPTAPTAPTTTVATAAGLLDLAALVAGTAHHPYAPELDTAGVAQELGVWADLRPDAATWRQALQLRHAVALPARRLPPSVDAEHVSRVTQLKRLAQLESALRERHSKVVSLQAMATRQERRIRALEHAIKTEHGPRARQALFLMTAPTSRLVEAARSRFGNRPGR